MNSDRRPLLLSPKEENHENNETGMAVEWPCAACATLLGIAHLSMGLGLLAFDVVTNETSETAFAATAALAYIICSVLSFIAARRLDRCAQLLLFAFAAFSALTSLSIFLEAAVVLNRLCGQRACTEGRDLVHSTLICIALTEFVISSISMIVCYRSLRNAFGVNTVASPYSTLIVGDYTTLERQPRPMRNTRAKSLL
ncbi:unnamed protein product, partial [Mesorhabditis belari]|uniref:Uncharacterized protein n=1 Tax=Mesorhabditis belari TaxID=2138241 RepID=A0AAF3J2D2_9BILA